MSLSDRSTGKGAILRALGIGVVVSAAMVIVLPRCAEFIVGLYPLPQSTARMVASYAAGVAVLAGSSLLFLGSWVAPACVLAWRLAPQDSVSVRSLRTLVIAFVLLPCVHAMLLMLGLRDAPGKSHLVAAVCVQLSLLCLALLTRPTRPTGPAAQAANSDTSQRSRWLLMGTAYVFLCALLLPRLAWQDFNPDGLELLTVGRSVSHFVMARLPTGELPGVSLGMATIAYPVHWMISFAGAIEFSARLPFLLYAVLVALGSVAVIESQSPRRLSTSEFALVVTGALVVCLTIGINGSYDPYSTDLASPASIDILALALLLSAFHFALRCETSWAVASAILLSLTRPSGPLLCGLLTVGLFLTGPRNRARWQTAALMTLAAFGVSAVYAFGMEMIGVGPMAEGADNLASRLRYLRFDDWRRWLWLIVPSGIIPVFALPRVRSLNPDVRAIVLVILGYFALFYSLAFVALHHFAPVMLLPMVAYWRWVLDDPARSSRRQRIIVAVGLAAAGWAAMPTNLRVFRRNRDLGEDLDYRIGVYDGGYAEYRSAFEGRTILDSLFAPYWQNLDSLPERTAGPWVLIHYATRSPKPPTQRQYSVHRLGDASTHASIAVHRIAQEGDIGLFVADSARWLAERRTPPPAAPRHWMYAVPRSTLFRHLGVAAGAYQIDLRALLPVAPGP